MVLASVPAGIIRYTLGVEVGELTTTAIPEVDIINSAQEALCNMRPWRWLKRQSVPLALVQNQAWVDLPADFRELVKVLPLGSQLASLVETSVSDILMLRAGGTQTLVGLGSYYYAIENAVPETKNIVNATENFADASNWAPVACTVSSNAVTAPNGSLTADTLTISAAAGRMIQDIPRLDITPGRAYVLSAYMKAGTSGATDLELKQQGAGSPAETSSVVPETIVRVTWTAGVGTAALLSSQGLGVHNVGIEATNDGWYRVYTVVNFDDDAAKPNAEFRIGVRPDPANLAGSVSVWGVQLERWDGDPDLAAPTKYVANLGVAPDNFGEPVRRMAIWPTPTTTTYAAFMLAYRRRPRRIVSETETIEIPTWIEPLFFETCRLYARGAHEEDDGHLYERLEGLRRSIFFHDAVEQDESEQRSIGQMRGLAASQGVVTQRWPTSSVEAP